MNELKNEWVGKKNNELINKKIDTKLKKEWLNNFSLIKIKLIKCMAILCWTWHQVSQYHVVSWILYGLFMYIRLSYTN